MADRRKTDTSDITIEEKLRALYNLQEIHSAIDRINILRGELPLEVQDLEDSIMGLNTRIAHFQDDVKDLEKEIAKKKNDMAVAREAVAKYQAQQNNVRNNREYEALSKEIENQSLEIELCEKRIKEYGAEIVEKNEAIEQAGVTLGEYESDLKNKQQELEEIIADTAKEEEQLMAKVKDLEDVMEPRLLNAYEHIRQNARNGLAVVMVQRDACGGCFSKIPPQRQLDIRSRKKIIVCEYCGRILVDPEINQVSTPEEA
ncbi:MAG: hypothetical protein K6F98_03860 [Bacteroidales bacterium]|nr:hypothetical protein [Bacteroidales bacterium]MBR3286933.1 hypothetical protein [Bacteroidales bacterium]MCR5714052.1 hypothetical protein [Bacteroidales bacterium]